MPYVSHLNHLNITETLFHITTVCADIYRFSFQVFRAACQHTQDPLLIEEKLLQKHLEDKWNLPGSGTENRGCLENWNNVFQTFHTITSNTEVNDQLHSR